MLDGATVMDPGVNRPASRVSVEAIAEVKVVTSGYQAEYGRSSGLQINAVTKSGTEPVPRLALRRRAQVVVGGKQQDQHPQRRPEAAAERT
jgi:hypothetical protein